jgi:hypothetical protein
MSDELHFIWRSEAVIYGFAIVNLIATAVVLVVAWRRGMFKNLDAAMRTGLDLPGTDHSNQTKESHS